MGQAWCKEKSSKAQDSKSPLDRVFVRCAHTIYPGLKEEGSVLGSATQRVTSSEIGYASSPPRAALLRGQSIDSVDRPFHPSEWVDVNLEVPCAPGACNALLANLSGNQRRSANLTKSNGARNPKDQTMSNGAPVPPPRRRKRREKRPLPPKPGAGNTADDESEPEPLYSKVMSPKSVAPVDSSTVDAYVDGCHDSEDEFIAIENTLKKRSLEDIATSRRSASTSSSRPKNRSTTSLPNVAELLDAEVEASLTEESPKRTTTTTTTTTTSSIREEVAKRPLRHIKTASLPREVSLCAPHTPERIFFSRRIEEDRGEDLASAADSTDSKDSSALERDNSIFKIDASALEFGSLEIEIAAATSTPVKVAPAASDRDDASSAAPVTLSSFSANLDDLFHSFNDRSSAVSFDSSSRLDEAPAVVAVVQGDERPDGANQESPSRRNEDAGYESKNNSRLFSEGSNESSSRSVDRRIEELSSGILRDAGVDSNDFMRLDNPAEVLGNVGAAMLQRTISEESLPREMLVDELEDDEDEEDRLEKSAKDASNELARRIDDANGRESFITPPASPRSRLTFQTSSSSLSSKRVSDGRATASTAEQPAAGTASGGADEGNPTSMTPSLMELGAALGDMLEKRGDDGDEEDDEREEEEEEEEEKEREKVEGDKSSDASPEPQIVPVKRNRALEDVDELGKASSAPQHRRQHRRQQPLRRENEPENEPENGRLIDFPRADRTNPFNDSTSDDRDTNLSTEDQAPEKPSRLHRVSLIEEEATIEEPLIVPTPPRRRHRSKSNLSPSTESTEPIHTYATHDRLI